MINIILLSLLGALLLGVIIFGILVPFSLNNDAKQDMANRIGIYAFPKMFLSKYYRPERLWVRKGLLICSIFLFVSLACMYVYFLSTGAFNSRFNELNR